MALYAVDKDGNKIRIAGAGTPGKDGVGVPAGGTTGQLLVKTGPDDYATGWKTLTAQDIPVTAPAGMTATDVQGAVSELFTSVSNGKSLVASAITDKGVPTAADATFQTMHDNILEISGGGSCSPFQVAASETTVFVGVIVVSGICKQYQNIKGAI